MCSRVSRVNRVNKVNEVNRVNRVNMVNKVKRVYGGLGWTCRLFGFLGVGLSDSLMQVQVKFN